MKVLITGSNGQLGLSFKSRANLAASLGIQLLFADRQQLDITQPAAIAKFLQQNPVDLIVNTAAYTAVDRAESEPDQATLINCVGPENLARYCAQHNCHLIHVSTDYVFDGNQEKPYCEEDPVSPLGVYGETKYQGELAVLREYPQAIILRTSWVFSEFGNNFLKTMLRLAQTRDHLGVVCDQWGAPTYAPHIAEAILSLIKHHQKGSAGIYHFSGDEKTHWQAFAKEIFAIAVQQNPSFPVPEVAPISSAEYPTPVTRPLNSHMSNQKILELLPDVNCNWRQGLLDAINALQQDIK
ncbi:MAG: dTDP-4-dehydrorhamnose reductase [Oleiphilaceae bacterium]|jgi:dTDP-4-dehydrorhamnose reductase